MGMLRINVYQRVSTLFTSLMPKCVIKYPRTIFEATRDEIGQHVPGLILKKKKYAYRPRSVLGAIRCSPSILFDLDLLPSCMHKTKEDSRLEVTKNLYRHMQLEVSPYHFLRNVGDCTRVFRPDQLVPSTSRPPPLSPSTPLSKPYYGNGLLESLRIHNYVAQHGKVAHLI
jgi:hypothetical protein